MQQITFSSPSLSYKTSTITVDILDTIAPKYAHILWKIGSKIFYNTKEPYKFLDLHYSAIRTSVYNNSLLKLSTPEHLTPVFLMWPSQSFAVNINQTTPEVPLLDGSAINFFCALRKFLKAPIALDFYNAKIKAEWNLLQNGRIFGNVKITPSETFEVEYNLVRKANVDGYNLESFANVSIYSPEDLFQIFEARTFIHSVEYAKAKKTGLLQGVSENCGLLLNEEDAATPLCKKFRIKNEPAMHKILDLIGDITFVCPKLPKVRIEITNGGHKAHRQIMEKLLPYVTSNTSEI